MLPDGSPPRYIWSKPVCFSLANLLTQYMTRLVPGALPVSRWTSWTSSGRPRFCALRMRALERIQPCQPWSEFCVALTRRPCNSTHIGILRIPSHENSLQNPCAASQRGHAHGAMSPDVNHSLSPSHTASGSLRVRPWTGLRKPLMTTHHAIGPHASTSAWRSCTYRSSALMMMGKHSKFST